MKKIMSLILFSALCLGCMTMSISADYTEEDLLGAKLQGLFYQESDFLYSDLAEDYEAWWWDDYVEELDSVVTAAYINMRGFSMSADGRYAYMGTLNGGTGMRGVVVLDTQVGKITDMYYSYNEENALPGSPFSYAKGIAADDRGYVYVGFAYSVNYNYLSLGIAQQGADGKLTEVVEIPVYQNDLEPGDEAGTKVGVNGVEVARQATTITSYNVWDTPVIEGIAVAEGDVVTIGLYTKCSGSGNGAWGKIDDAKLNKMQ